MPYRDPKSEAARASKNRYNRSEAGRANWKRYYQQNPEVFKKRNREYYLQKLYGISFEQYDEMVSRQRGLCALCGHADLKRGLCVDHDHGDGRIRGLLCGKCNKGLGLLGDDRDSLMRAIEYLEASR